MICPECGAEYVLGLTRCVDCGGELVDALPEPLRPAPQSPQATHLPRNDPPDHFELVTVLATSNPGLMPLAKSLLQSAQIPFVVEGEGIQDLFGIGRLSFNPITGPAALRVASQDAADARALLADLSHGSGVAAGDDVAHI